MVGWCGGGVVWWWGGGVVGWWGGVVVWWWGGGVRWYVVYGGIWWYMVVCGGWCPNVPRGADATVWPLCAAEAKLEQDDLRLRVEG